MNEHLYYTTETLATMDGFQRGVVIAPGRITDADNPSSSDIQAFIETFIAANGSCPLFAWDIEGYLGHFGAKFGVERAVNRMMRAGEALLTVRDKLELGDNMLIGYYASPFCRRSVLARGGDEAAREIEAGVGLVRELADYIDFVSPNVYPKSTDPSELDIMQVMAVAVGAANAIDRVELVLPFVNWSDARGVYIGDAAFTELVDDLRAAGADGVIAWNKDLYEMKLNHRAGARIMRDGFNQAMTDMSDERFAAAQAERAG